MGGSPSKELTQQEILATFDPDDERVLLRNFRLAASRDTSDPGRFGAAEWGALPLGMPSALQAAVFDGLRSGVGGETSDAAAVDLDALARAVGLPLADGQPLAAGLLLHDCCVGKPLSEAGALCAAAATWLASVDTSGVTTDRAALWKRLVAAAPRPPRGSFAPLELPPRPASRPEYAECVARSAALNVAACVLAAAVQAAWLLDHRSLAAPLPQLTQGSSALLGEADLRLLSDALPPRCRLTWRLVFSSARDGTSFSRLCALGARASATVLVVRDAGGAVFGGFCAAPLAKSPRWFGDYACFVYSLRPRAAAVHRASGENAHFVMLNAGMEQLPNGLAFGGDIDSRFFGLWLRDDLETGRSCAPCSTYQGLAAPLCSAAGDSGGAEFGVDVVELWAVDDDLPEDDEPQGTALDGVMGEQHTETRAFLEMAGKTQHAANLAPLPDEGSS